MIALGAIDDDRMLLDGLGVWLDAQPDLRLVAWAGTVEEFLAASLGHPADVVLLDLRLGDGSDPVRNVRRLTAAGARVLVMSQLADPQWVAAALEAGAGGYLTKDHDLPTLAAAARDVAGGRLALSPEPAFALTQDRRPDRPHLSAQERAVLIYYASGMTLDAAARRAGIRPATAKGYLERVKEKYREAGRVAYTKLDLANLAREDDWL